MSYRSHGTVEEIKFICMMINNEIQLPNNHACSRFKPIEKLKNYQEAIKKRDRWGTMNKDIITTAVGILKEKISNNENTMDYNDIHKQASLKY